MGDDLGAVWVLFLDGTSACPWDCADADGNVGITDFLALIAQWGGPGPCDFDGGDVHVTDFLLMLAAWGPNPGHPADLNGDDTVNVTDFLLLLADWGPCP